MHTAERWPAPGTHAGSHLRTVQLAKDIDKVAGSLQAIDLDIDLVLGLSPCTCKSETGTLTHSKLQGAGHLWIYRVARPVLANGLGLGTKATFTFAES